MHTIKLIVLSLALSFPSLTYAVPHGAVQTEKDLYEECGAYSQEGMRDCLAKKAAESQVVLKKTEEMIGVSLAKWDEDNKYVSLAKARLIASNRAFPKYREAQCEFSASLSGGGAGNAHEMGRLACVTELNSRRAEQLRNAVANLPLK
jgi:uncharacterized protein YecT (DUF1311 family)